MEKTKFPQLSIVPKGASGIEIRALMGKKYNCVEFVMRDDVPQTVFISPWIQFEPTDFYEDRLALAYEMVRRFNQHEAMLEELNKARVKASTEYKSAQDLIDRERKEMRDFYEQKVIKLIKKLLPYAKDSLEEHQIALKDADPQSQFYGEDIVTYPIITEAENLIKNFEGQ